MKAKTKPVQRKNKLRKGDNVIIIAGKDKGRQGEVLRVNLKKSGDTYLYVSGSNMVKKHKRPNPNMNEPGGIIEKEAPLHISNVAIYNPDSKRADRVGYKVLNDGRKVRVYKSNGEQIDV